MDFENNEVNVLSILFSYYVDEILDNMLEEYEKVFQFFLVITNS